ncbi:histidine--tRNA ligase [Actinomadura sp. WMMB 499]|uniref:histidine--tRNA ligase n=1 Tax=Actinomadura sp. WMMB 499 TaxID=1219491 RepID=UPI0012473CD2|nr:histidine--tRNA ligase [Actinomadura sp. WMMB 499]QFG22799.1 histidine--tRNA ligase [Actinomadura sp. WMMB 499]
MASQQFDPPSGTRDFLAGDLHRRERVFEAARSVFTRYGFEPLQTPAFERLETLTGKYGDEGDKLIFKILKRGAHEASGEADMALRYDLTVPLARVVAAHGSRLPTPYKRYAIGPVWRADRPGKGRFREFTQCDVDIVGSSSPLVEAEVVCAGADALDAMGVRDFTVLVNSRRALTGLMQVYGVPADRAAGALITLDKLDKQEPAAVVAELVEARGLDRGTAGELVRDVTANDAVDRMRAALKDSAEGREGLAEVDRLLELAGPHVGAARIRFAPDLVRGLDYYTGAIWEVVAPGMPGSIASGGRYDHLIRTLGGPDVTACGFSIGVERIIGALGGADDGTGRIDVAVTIMNEDYVTGALGFAQELRRAGWRAEIFLGTGRKLGKQLKWASDRHARFALLQGDSEHAEGAVTIRNMETGDQERVPVTGLFTALDSALRM